MVATGKTYENFRVHDQLYDDHIRENKMNQEYRDAISKMEDMTVNPEYILGWQGGFLGHPKREEQRLTEAYEAGYEDGEEKTTGNFSNWVAE